MSVVTNTYLFIVFIQITNCIISNLCSDGFISNEELFKVLKMMTGDNLTDMQLQQIVNRTILYLDKDCDGRIGLDEFTQGAFLVD